MTTSPAKVLIVGGGASGLFVAHGLAERGDVAVTVVEAGTDPGTPLPRQVLRDYIFPDGFDWGYRDARGRPLPRGRVLGGSSTVNSAAALRGQPWDYDAWGPGWTFADCLPAFRALERDEQFGMADHHGDAGPIPITRLPLGAIDEAFIEVCAAAGHPAAPDHNAPGALGIGQWPANRVDEARWGTLAALAPGLRGRVTLLTDTTAHRLVVRGDRVAAVEARGPDGTRVLEADLIVLSCGTYGTPELLLRSGLDLPGVGAGLQDHPWVLLDVLAADPAAPSVRPVSGALLTYAPDPASRDQMQIFPFQSKPYEPAAPGAQVSFAVGLMAPRGRGSLTVTGRGTGIDPGHFAGEGDLEGLTQAVAYAGELLGKLAADGVIELPDRPWWQEVGLAAQVADRSVSYHHPVGTCRMGDDPEAVVDRTLRVRGLSGLMIADASVAPAVPRANTNLMAMMIGVRAAQLIS